MKIQYLLLIYLYNHFTKKMCFKYSDKYIIKNVEIINKNINIKYGFSEYLVNVLYYILYNYIH